jgi:hypothetical protein
VSRLLAQSLWASGLTWLGFGNPALDSGDHVSDRAHRAGEEVFVLGHEPKSVL